MTEDQPAVSDAGPVASIVRLHGEACWQCGAVNTRLQPAGEVATQVEGGKRIWPVVACPDHLHAVREATR